MNSVFAIRREVIEKMLENPEFRKRLVYETAKRMV